MMTLEKVEMEYEKKRRKTQKYHNSIMVFIYAYHDMCSISCCPQTEYKNFDCKETAVCGNLQFKHSGGHRSCEEGQLNRK